MNTIISLAVVALACMVGLSYGYYPVYQGGYGAGGFNVGMGGGAMGGGGGGIFSTLIFLFVFIFITRILFNSDSGLLGTNRRTGGGDRWDGQHGFPEDRCTWTDIYSV